MAFVGFRGRRLSDVALRRGAARLLWGEDVIVALRLGRQARLWGIVALRRLGGVVALRRVHLRAVAFQRLCGGRFFFCGAFGGGGAACCGAAAGALNTRERISARTVSVFGPFVGARATFSCRTRAAVSAADAFACAAGVLIG